MTSLEPSYQRNIRINPAPPSASSPLAGAASLAPGDGSRPSVPSVSAALRVALDTGSWVPGKTATAGAQHGVMDEPEATSSAESGSRNQFFRTEPSDFFFAPSLYFDFLILFYEMRN